jgi:hypothetical protein
VFAGPSLFYFEEKAIWLNSGENRGQFDDWLIGKKYSKYYRKTMVNTTLPEAM